MLIFISGPLAGKDGSCDVRNVYHAVKVAGQLFQKGHLWYVPHLSMWQDTILRLMGLEVPYEDWMILAFMMIERCDALYYMGPSPGADRERAFAEKMGKQVFTNMAEVPDLTKGE